MARKKGNSLRLEMMVMLSAVLAIFFMTGIVFPTIISSSTIPVAGIIFIMFLILFIIGAMASVIARVFRKRWKI